MVFPCILPILIHFRIEFGHRMGMFPMLLPCYFVPFTYKNNKIHLQIDYIPLDIYNNIQNIERMANNITEGNLISSRSTAFVIV